MDNVFRDFANALRRTKRILRCTHFFFKVGKIIAFGGDDLTRILPRVPLNEVILRASSPCLTPIPFEKGQGRSSCVGGMTVGLTRVCNLSFGSISEVATGGTLGIFGVTRWIFGICWF